MEGLVEINLPPDINTRFGKHDILSTDSLNFCREMVKDLNLDLGTTNDPEFHQFQRFMNEIEKERVDIIKVEDIESRDFSKVNLNGEAKSPTRFIVDLINNIVECKTGNTIGAGDFYRLRQERSKLPKKEQARNVFIESDVTYTGGDIFRSSQVIR